MRTINADELNMIKFHPLPYTHITPSDVNVESYERGWNDAIDAIMDNSPTIEAVPKNMVFHVDTYDDMEEEYAIEELTLEELLDKFTDEGYPNASNVLDALEVEE